jgi:hypothetical protein
MPQQLLDRSNVRATLKQVRGEGMPERMARGSFRETGHHHGISDGFLHQRFVNMMATLFLSPHIAPAVFLGKGPLPTPVLRRVGILPVEGVWKLDASPPIGHILLMNSLDLREVVLERGLRRCGKHSDAVFRPLAVANENLIPREIDIPASPYLGEPSNAVLWHATGGLPLT